MAQAAALAASSCASAQTESRRAFELDALAGGPGRVEDVSAKVAYDNDDRRSVTAGYRTVEGGADPDDAYSFAWFHYAGMSGIYRF